MLTAHLRSRGGVKEGKECPEGIKGAHSSSEESGGLAAGCDSEGGGRTEGEGEGTELRGDRRHNRKGEQRRILPRVLAWDGQ